MTVDGIAERIRAIRDIGGEAETSHIAEDDLHQDVLRAIADGAPNARELAEEALKTLLLGFDRWYA